MKNNNTLLHPKIQDLRTRSKAVNFAEVVPLSLIGDNAPDLEERIKGLNLAEDEFAAYFCVWGVRDSHGTGWVRGCFSKSINERGPKSKANQKIVVCWQHDLMDPIGRPVEISEDDYGAFIRGKFDDPEAVPNAKRANSQIRSGTLNGFSFGFNYVWDKMEYDEDTDTIWNKETELFEVSPVTFASIKETKSVRSLMTLDTRRALLKEETEEYIKTLPRGKQLELRQLIYEYQTLIDEQPDAQRTLDKDQPSGMKLGGLVIDVNKF